MGMKFKKIKKGVWKQTWTDSSGEKHSETFRESDYVDSRGIPKQKRAKRKGGWFGDKRRHSEAAKKGKKGVTHYLIKEYKFRSYFAMLDKEKEVRKKGYATMRVPQYDKYQSWILQVWKKKR